MTIRISLLTVLFAFSSLGAFAQQTQSDYQIQKMFKQQYEDYLQRIEVVTELDSAQALIDSIRQFNERFSKHKKLLNKVLHPDNYTQRMENLKKSSVVAKNRIKKAQKRTQRLKKLEKEVGGYEKKLKQLSTQTDSLKTAIQKSVQSEKKLSGMVRQYRKRLEKRDELILAFIDSMVTAYRQMNIQQLQGLEKINKKSQLESDANALQMIRDISAENLDILQKNAGKLRLQDYMRMAQVQQEFESMWEQLGGRIQKVYTGQETDKLAGEIDQNISEWNQMLQKQTFTTLKDTLAAKNIQVEGFDNPDQLYSSLNTYLDRKIKQSRENGGEGYSDYQNFKEFWNDVETRWTDNFVDTGLITEDQMATINKKVDTWDENAQPPSSNILIYLLGFAVLLAIVLGVLWARERQNRDRT